MSGVTLARDLFGLQSVSLRARNGTSTRAGVASLLSDQTELSTRSRNVYRTSLVSYGINCGQMMITDGF
jgi:hypothetical protein